jgi:hypothetical protein
VSEPEKDCVALFEASIQATVRDTTGDIRALSWLTEDPIDATHGALQARTPGAHDGRLYARALIAWSAARSCSLPYRKPA